MNPRKYDILVVGAGMVGATFATAMAKKGFSVAVFDHNLPKTYQMHEPPDIQVSAVNKSTEHILTNLGAWHFMQQLRMCPYNQLEVWEKAQFINPIHPFSKKTCFDATLTQYKELGFIIENWIIQQGLITTMAQYHADFFCPAHIKSIDLSGIQPQINLNDGRQFQGHLLVGADGKDSRIRKEAQIKHSEHNYSQHCFVATVELATPHGNKTWQAFTPTGPEAFLPLPSVASEHYATLIWYHKPSTVQHLKTLDDKAVIQLLQSTYSKDLPNIVKLVGRATFPIGRLHAHQYYKGNVVLIGDAVHAIHPLAGQGVNLGIQDAASLSTLLYNSTQKGNSLSHKDTLKSYDKLRRPKNMAMMYLVDSFHHIFSNNYLPLKLSRRLGLHMVNHLPYLRKKIVAYAMGTTHKQPELEKQLNLYKNFSLNKETDL